VPGPAGPCLPQDVQPPADGVKIIKSDMTCWITGKQRGGLILCSRPLQGAEQAADSVGVVERDLLSGAGG
jgi:hypothetical protein